MSAVDSSLSQYRELRTRVDALFGEIRARHPDSFACRLGCHACCKPGLTVNALEREEIARFLSTHPELFAELLAMEKTDPHSGKRCAFLGSEGTCRIYESRPLVCRSHGAPLQFRPLQSRPGDESAVRERDACPLNFTGENIGTLPASDVINLDTLNTLLALLSQRAFPGDESRTPLRASALGPK